MKNYFFLGLVLIFGFSYIISYGQTIQDNPIRVSSTLETLMIMADIDTASPEALNFLNIHDQIDDRYYGLRKLINEKCGR